MAGGGGHRIDVGRKSFIVLLLILLMVGLHQFGPENASGSILLAVGFVILASYTVGELAEVVKLPHITGYLLAGVLLGESFAHTIGDLGFASLIPAPFNHGVLTSAMVESHGSTPAQLWTLDTLALALICLTAGGELKLEQLRAGLRPILSILTAQSLTILGLVTGAFVLFSGPLPFLTHPSLASLSLAQAAAVGLTVAAISLATAPAATIAVINSTGAKGPMTQTVLSTVVLKDVVVVLTFAIATSVAVGSLGVGEAEGISAALKHIFTSIILGVAAGGVIAVYLQYVNQQIMVFLVGAIFVVAYATESLHGEAALVFIAAGFTVSNAPNFGELGDKLIHEVERLAMPVYVVFFTMAGAKLHVEQLVDAFAFAVVMVTVRIFALYLGVRAGAVLGQADANSQKYGWMGFISQAGVAITLAQQLTKTFPGELGSGLFSIVIAGVAINEIVGPIALQLSLNWSGEAAGSKTELSDDPTEEELPADQSLPNASNSTTFNPWGESTDCGVAELNEVVDDLVTEFQTLVSDLNDGPLADQSDAQHDYLNSLRREFLRHHRRIMVRAQTDPSELADVIHTEVGALADAWRDQLLDRSATVTTQKWSPQALVDIVDNRVQNLPEDVVLPLDSTSLTRRSEPRWRAFRRGILRARVRLQTVTRPIAFRALARYHLTGRVPAKLEGIAALMVNAELNLADVTARLFDVISGSYSAAARAAADGSEDLHRILLTIREEVETDFYLAAKEVDRLPQDGERRASQILGGAIRDVKADLKTIGTLDLPAYQRRFGRVFAERNHGLSALGPGLSEARHTASLRFKALALAFEVVGLEGRVETEVEAHANTLSRQIAGRGLTQVDRVLQAVTASTGELEQLLQAPPQSAVDLHHQIEQLVEPNQHLTEDAVNAAVQLRDWLGTEVSDSPLLDGLLRAAQGLTDRYEIPTERPVTGEWRLPQPLPSAEVPFRELTVSFIEAQVTRDLIDVTRSMAVKVDRLVAGLEELDRVLGFNLELAETELQVHGDQPVPDDTIALLKDALLNSTGRLHARLKELRETATPWPEEARDGVRTAVMDKLATFRMQVFDGELVHLRATIRQQEARSLILQQVGLLQQRLEDISDDVWTYIQQSVGRRRLDELREQLGLPAPPLQAANQPFAAPVPMVDLPVVYRRLFSDQALEAGDLLMGRQEDLGDIKRTLENHCALRSVALVGEDSIGQNALLSAIQRIVPHRSVHRIQLHAPTDVATVQGWFRQCTEDHLTIITGLQHLYERRPGGLYPLEALAQGMVHDRGRNMWVLATSPGVFQSAKQLTAFADALARVIHQIPLSVELLQAAMLERHAMSGFQLEFTGMNQERRWIGNSDARIQRAWFETLHSACGGHLHEALELWLASVESVSEEEGVITMGHIPRPPVGQIAATRDETQLTLHQLLLQGWMDAPLHAEIFGQSVPRSQAHLAHLCQAGLLRRQGDRYELAPHLRGPVMSVFERRGWL